MLNRTVWNRTVLIYKNRFGINNLQWLICHETKPNQFAYPYDSNFVITLTNIIGYIINKFRRKPKWKERKEERKKEKEVGDESTSLTWYKWNILFVRWSRVVLVFIWWNSIHFSIVSWFHINSNCFFITTIYASSFQLSVTPPTPANKNHKKTWFRNKVLLIRPELSSFCSGMSS